LPGRGTVSVATDDPLGMRLFVVPGARLRMRAAGTQLAGVAVCSLGCSVSVAATVRPNDGGAAIRTPASTFPIVTSRGRTLPIRIDTDQRRRIRRAGGAAVTLSIRWLDLLGKRHRATAKLRLLPR
jgi:hypothetical protein